MKHIEHHEPDGGGAGGWPEQRSKSRPQNVLQIVAQWFRPQNAKPDDGQNRKI